MAESKIPKSLASDVNTLKGNKPTNLFRPLTANQTSDFKYTAPHDGTIYLVFVSTTRSYCSILWNDANVGGVALPDNTAPCAQTATVAMKKGDRVRVAGLNTNCYLLASQTAFIANASDI
jgi:hypothetical protein